MSLDSGGAGRGERGRDGGGERIRKSLYPKIDLNHIFKS